MRFRFRKILIITAFLACTLSATDAVPVTFWFDGGLAPNSPNIISPFSTGDAVASMIITSTTEPALAAVGIGAVKLTFRGMNTNADSRGLYTAGGNGLAIQTGFNTNWFDTFLGGEAVIMDVDLFSDVAATQPTNGNVSVMDYTARTASTASGLNFHAGTGALTQAGLTYSLGGNRLSAANDATNADVDSVSGQYTSGFSGAVPDVVPVALSESFYFSDSDTIWLRRSNAGGATDVDFQLVGMVFDIMAPPPVIPSGPNVIVFLMDDLGLTDVQEHPTYFPDGSPLFETPNMHRLAEQGMRFNHAYAQPLCSASRLSLLSGQYSAARHSLYMAIVPSAVPVPSLPASSAATQAYNHPTDRDHMPLEVETIAERLKAAGYATWHAGKWHLSPEPTGTNSNPPETYYPDKQGFDKQLSVGGAGPSPGYFGPFTMPDMVDHAGNPAAGTSKDYIADHMASLVQGLLDDHLANDPTRPFFLYYPTYSVHYPHQAKRSRFDYYETKLAGLVDSKHQHPVMAAQVEGVDTELGALLDYMDAHGLTDNTLFIFLSDNGGLSWESDNGLSYVFDDIGPDGIPDAPGVSSDGTYFKTVAPGIDPDTRITNMAPRRGGKGALFEGGIRIPMIVRYPNGNIVSNAASDEPVHLIDIYQTILDYTSATPKAGYTLDGVSLKPVLEQTGSLANRDLFHYFPRDNTTYQVEPESGGIYPGGTAVLDAPFKMIARYSTGHDAATVDYQLFRLDVDEGESNNVAGLYPEVVDAMRKQLDGFYTETGAFVPTPNPAYGGTRFDSPEINIDSYLVAAGLTPLSPETFDLADPDGDRRNNRQEFLEQTGPNTSDTGTSTIWIYDNGGTDELRFALPANTDQSTISILDQTGAVAFTPSSGLELDGQYGPFFIYKPSSPVPAPNPANYTIVVADTPATQSMTEFTVDYRALLNGSVSSSVDNLLLNDNLLVDTGSGLGVIQDVTVTTSSLGGSGTIQPAGPHGLAVLGGANSLWFDSGETVDLAFALQTTDGTPVTNLQLEIIDVGARAVDSETMTFLSPSASATALWAGGPEDNGRPGILAGTREFTSDETLNVQTGSLSAALQRTQLSYVTFKITGLSIDNTDTDGDLLPDEYESANGLNPTDPADGNIDFDGDGLTRGQEYVADTSDSDKNDRFTFYIQVQADGQGGTESVLWFDVKDRRAYRLYRRNTLDEPPVLMEDFGMISGNHSVQLSNALDGQSGFYHLEAYLP